MASFAEVAAQSESVILPASGSGDSNHVLRTSATFQQQQAANNNGAQSQACVSSNVIIYDDSVMKTEEDSRYVTARPVMTLSPSAPAAREAGDALSALAALATSAAMQRDGVERDDDHQILRSSAPIAIARNTITPHQTSSDDDSEAMPPPPPRIPTAVPPLQPQPYPTNTVGHGFTSILAFHNDTDALFSTTSSYSQNRRVGGRIRSASNPEGMEKWDSYTRRNDRMHFVLPSSILEEELASTKRILEEKKMEEDYVKGYSKRGDSCTSSSPLFGTAAEFSSDQPQNEDTAIGVSANANTTNFTTKTASRRSKRPHKPKSIFGTSPDSVSSDLNPPVSTSRSKKKNQSSTTTPLTSSSRKVNNTENLTSNIGHVEQEEIDESLLEPEELLRRARSRLLEDLSEGSEAAISGGLNGEKSVLALPHSLGKYKEVSFFRVEGQNV